MKVTGILSKMETIHGTPINYFLRLGQINFALTPLVGKEFSLIPTGNIFCTNCGKKTKKSYSQGYCFPCTIKLAECDLCILRPETCHYDQGTCREPSWGEENCMRPHVVYLANSSGVKVGITRKSQVPTRWMDQGASRALPVMEVKTRKDSGLIEVLFKQHISDKTDWRKMLKGDPVEVDLVATKNRLLAELQGALANFEYKLLDEPVMNFSYPIEQYPDKVSSLNLEKVKEVKGRLMGIKGQYLIFDTGVFNVRSHTGHEVIVEGA